MKNKTQKSICCNADVKVEGDITYYYVCLNCFRGCDTISIINNKQRNNVKKDISYSNNS